VAVRLGAEMEDVRRHVQAVAARTGGPIRLLVGKPGLDGHSNGAEQIAVAARDAGMEVVYQGIRLTPSEIAAAARDEDADVVGLSILSGSHLALVPETVRALRDLGVDAPVVVGGIIPDADRAQLEGMGVARVYTPKDFRLAAIMRDIADLAAARRSSPQAEAATGR
jgi:(2R)-ethylmalonyl-CoA mutase